MILVLKVKVITESKDTKACFFVNLLDRSSSLVWMTHSHCVREELLRKGRGFKSHPVHGFLFKENGGPLLGTQILCRC